MLEPTLVFPPGENLNQLPAFLEAWWKENSYSPSHQRYQQTPWTLTQPLTYTGYRVGLWGDIADADEWNAIPDRLEKILLENMDRPIGCFQIVQKRDRRRKSQWLWAVRKIDQAPGAGVFQ